MSSSNTSSFFASLQLPRSSDEGPTLCFLVVADMDLPSASALAESALTTLPASGTLVDGICACGPFVSTTSLQPYLTTQQPPSSHPVEPISLEWTHALEGLVTGCLSQLESIVCRVLWIPDARQDPSTLTEDKEEQRLTPNSRNVHKQILPLAPGLSCCGLAIPSKPKNGGGKSEDYVENSTPETVEKLMDCAPPLSEQLEENTECRISIHSAIVLTSSAEPPSRLAGDERILLHIHSDSENFSRPSYRDGVLYPGSLKTRGDYCLVYVSLVEDVGDAVPDSENCEHLFQWQVAKVEFFQIDQDEYR